MSAPSMRVGPSSAGRLALTPLHPVSPPCSPTWKETNSLRAATSRTAELTPGWVRGRTFSMALARPRRRGRLLPRRDSEHQRPHTENTRKGLHGVFTMGMNPGTVVLSTGAR